MDKCEVLGDGIHLSPPVLPPSQFHCVTLGSYFGSCKLLQQSQKCVCRCIYDLFTFRAYLLEVYGPRGILDKLDSAVCVESDNAAVGFAARKNKTRCMTNTHVIHSQSMEGSDSMEYSTNRILARFIRLLYPQKVIARHWNSAFQKWPEDLGYVTGRLCRWHLAFMQKVNTFVPLVF